MNSHINGKKKEVTKKIINSRKRHPVSLVCCSVSGMAAQMLEIQLDLAEL